MSAGSSATYPAVMVVREWSDTNPSCSVQNLSFSAFKFNNSAPSWVVRTVTTDVILSLQIQLTEVAVNYLTIAPTTPVKVKRVTRFRLPNVCKYPFPKSGSYLVSPCSDQVVSSNLSVMCFRPDECEFCGKKWLFGSPWPKEVNCSQAPPPFTTSE